ncbi:DUF3089 domain-containing protein [Actinomadura rayongensis]|uniref:DUF3089 domain-containing protein n=1 Tax=Actinomadura rayongensis TaxID=1429076 RepID=A0A6I4WC75_9ACTN|nr:DUF3089 domain-containing protein [Actinomadura rayongensis]MXQ66430.1 DUF3089 domain-containing protein [Actinomadura rayongensis]
MRAHPLVTLAVASVLALLTAPAARADGDPDYGDARSWICRPGVRGPCDDDLDATVVPADGRLSVEHARHATAPPVDCFYVYPTVSGDPGMNSDTNWSPDVEGLITRQQAARFGSTCRVFAPGYRQITLTAIIDGRTSDTAKQRAADDFAYADVLRAWKHYLAHDNGGRGFLLLGHSQGAGMVQRLLREQIDPDPQLHARLIGAYMPSADGASPTTPLCSRYWQTGCVVTWASYRSDRAPTAKALLPSLFGRDPADGTHFPCVNPATLLKPSADPAASTWLDSYFPTRFPFGQYPYFTWQAPGPWVRADHGTVTTAFVRTPRFVTGRCVHKDGYSFFEITVHRDPADPRVDDIGGDMTPFAFYFVPTPRNVMGLHMADYDLVQGDLQRLAALQTNAYLGARPKLSPAG